MLTSMLLSLLLIANGTEPADGDFHAIGRLNWYCTAVLVRPDTVLTAKHCILPGQDHSVVLGNGTLRTITGFYTPVQGDVALGYLDSPVTTVTPIPMSFSGTSAAEGITIVGTGIDAVTKTCLTWVIHEDPYAIFFPREIDHPNPGCWSEQGDSGGGVIPAVGPRSIAGVIVGAGGATNLQLYVGDPQFNPAAVRPRPSAAGAEQEPRR